MLTCLDALQLKCTKCQCQFCFAFFSSSHMETLGYAHSARNVHLQRITPSHFHLSTALPSPSLSLFSFSLSLYFSVSFFFSLDLLILSAIISSYMPLTSRTFNWREDVNLIFTYLWQFGLILVFI